METKALEEQAVEAQLMGFSKGELRDLSAVMGLNPLASWEKEHISKDMVQYMKACPGRAASWFSHPLLEELRDMAEHGAMEEPVILERQAPAMAEQLLAVGLAQWRGSALVIWPMAFQMARASDKRQEKERFQMDLCAEGLLCAYGILEEGEWVRRMTVLYPQWDEARMARSLRARLELLGMTQRLVRNGRRWWADAQMDAPGKWIRWCLENRDMEYQTYSKEAYQKAALSGWIREPRGKEEILNCLVEHGMRREQAEDVLTMDMLERQNHPGHGQIPDFIRHFEAHHPMEAEKIAGLYRIYCQDMALWICKGSSLGEKK